MVQARLGPAPPDAIKPTNPGYQVELWPDVVGMCPLFQTTPRTGSVPRVWRGGGHEICHLRLPKVPDDKVCVMNVGPMIGAPDLWMTEGHRAGAVGNTAERTGRPI